MRHIIATASACPPPRPPVSSYRNRKSSSSAAPGTIFCSSQHSRPDLSYTMPLPLAVFVNPACHWYHYTTPGLRPPPLQRTPHHPPRGCGDWNAGPLPPQLTRLMVSFVVFKGRRRPRRLTTSTSVSATCRARGRIRTLPSETRARTRTRTRMGSRMAARTVSRGLQGRRRAFLLSFSSPSSRHE